MKENGVQPGPRFATSRDQLAFTAGELDVDPSRLDIAASAETAGGAGGQTPFPRAAVRHRSARRSGSPWPALYQRQAEELHEAIARSVDERIIRAFEAAEVHAFVQTVRERATEYLLSDTGEGNGNTLDTILKNALPKKVQRRSFVNALGSFEGDDFREFWPATFPPSRNSRQPGAVPALLVTHQSHALGQSPTVVTELQVTERDLGDVRLEPILIQ